MKVFCVYSDKDHLGCFQTKDEASRWIKRNQHEYGYYIDCEEEEDYKPKCDCKNEYLWLIPVVLS